MLEDIGNHNTDDEISNNNKKKTILLVTDNIQHYLFNIINNILIITISIIIK